MGRTTFEGIGQPLPGPRNIVVTRDPAGPPTASWWPRSSRRPSTSAADLDGDVMVRRGSQVYAAALPLADDQVLTEVHLDPEGDTRLSRRWTEAAGARRRAAGRRD